MLAAHAFASSIQSNMLANSARVHGWTRSRNIITLANVRLKWKGVCSGMPVCENMHFTWCHACCGSISTSVLTLRHFQHFNTLLSRSTHFLHRRQNGVQRVYKSLLQSFIHLVESRNRAGTRGAHTRHIFASFAEAHGEMTGDPTEGCTARQCTFREGLLNDEMLPFAHRWRYHDHNGSILRNGGWTTTLKRLFFFTLSPPDAQYEALTCLIRAIPHRSCTQIKTRKVHDNRSR